MKKYLIPTILIASLALAFGVYQYVQATTTIPIDSYSHYTEGFDLDSAGQPYFGQTFANTNLVSLDSVKFYLFRTSVTTGNLVAYVYNVTGTYGTTAKPTGSPIATSDNVTISSLTTSYSLIPFTFSGANRITLSANTKYAIVVRNLNPATTVGIGTDTSYPVLPTHAGNNVDSPDGTTWYTDGNNIDTVFYVYGVTTDEIYSLVGDGYVGCASGCGTNSWSARHDKVTGTVATYNTTVLKTGAGVDAFGEYDLARSLIPFDTSSIPIDAVIDSATLYTYTMAGGVDLTNDGYDYLGVVQTSQASSTILVTDDYNKVGATSSPALGSDTKLDYTDLVASQQYWAIPLNTTGKTWIKREGETSNCGTATGVTCLGLREGHDIENVDAFGDMSWNWNFLQVYSSEGTYPPFLVITYHVNPVGDGLLKVKEKTLIIKSGNLIIKGN